MAPVHKLNRFLNTRKGQFVAMLVIFAVILIFSVIIAAQQAGAPDSQDSAGAGICIPKSLQSTDSNCIFLEYAETPEEQAAGLSYRDNLALDRGMLFVFTDSAVRCFWMKDMNFSIDIVWLDSSANIVAKELDASPDTYPKNFCPDAKAQYVIEVNAGQAADWAMGTHVPL